MLVLHVALAVLFLTSARSPEGTQQREEVSTRIYLLTLPRHVREVRPRKRKAPPRSPRHSRHATESRAIGAAIRTEAPKVPVPRSSKLQWYQAADDVARSLTSAHQNQIRPGSGEHPPSPYRDCHRQPQFAWDPETHVVGLLHHWLPYLRLGNHCMVTLGFFGCAFGNLPGPNGHLFDSIRKDESPPAHTWAAAEPRGLCQ